MIAFLIVATESADCKETLDGGGSIGVDEPVLNLDGNGIHVL